MVEQEIELASAVSLFDLCQYLIASKWEIQPIPGDFAVCTLAVPGDKLQLLIPKTSANPDTVRWVKEAIRTLSQLTDITFAETVIRIRRVSSDILRSKIPDELVQNSSISLKIASGFVKNLRELFISVATTEIDPSPVFSRSYKEATVFADQCRFGHTFHGSFGFTVESPLAIEPSILEEGLIPFQRRVMERLMRGLDAVGDATKVEDPGLIAERFSSGFSANACAKLAKLLDETGIDAMELDFSLSLSLPPSSDIARDTEFKLTRPQIEVLKSAEKLLKEKGESLIVTVTGSVRRLESAIAPEDLIFRSLCGFSFDEEFNSQIVILWNSPDRGELKVKVHLSPGDYITALEAHRTGNLVSVQGRLEKRGRSFTLVDPADFTML